MSGSRPRPNNVPDVCDEDNQAQKTWTTRNHVLITILNNRPNTPLTRSGFSFTHVKTMAVLTANTNVSLHCFSSGYRLGSSVAIARGATKSEMSLRRLGVSISIPQPHMRHPVPTQSPPSIFC